MISLGEAIQLLSIGNSEPITFAEKHGDIFAPSLCVSEIRKRLDMKNIAVKKINTHRSPYDEEINWEFIVGQKEVAVVKGMVRRL